MMKKSGQTLIEVMVALFILTTGFIGILSLLAQSIHISKTVGDDTTATYLAAEGIELAKNLIDHDVYQHIDAAVDGPGWGTTLQPNHNYELDYTTCNNLGNQATLCSVPTFNPPGTFLGFNPSTDLYSYGSGAPTPYTREIKVTSDVPNELTVNSIVTWGSGLTTQSVDLQDDFYNWYPES